MNASLMWVRLVVAAIGLALCLYTWHDALLDFRVLRRLNLNSVREALTTGRLIDECIRLALHLGILYIAIDVSWRGGAARWPISGAFIIMTVLVVGLSVNNFWTLQRTLSLLRRPGEPEGTEK